MLVMLSTEKRINWQRESKSRAVLPLGATALFMMSDFFLEDHPDNCYGSLVLAESSFPELGKRLFSRGEEPRLSKSSNYKIGK